MNRNKLEIDLVEIFDNQRFTLFIVHQLSFIITYILSTIHIKQEVSHSWKTRAVQARHTEGSSFS